jgi:hypothetical protein
MYMYLNQLWDWSFREPQGMQNSEVNNVQNTTTILKVITKSSVGQHRPPTNAKVGSGAAEEKASSADRSHPPCALSQN